MGWDAFAIISLSKDYLWSFLTWRCESMVILLSLSGIDSNKISISTYQSIQSPQTFFFDTGFNSMQHSIHLWTYYVYRIYNYTWPTISNVNTELWCILQLHYLVKWANYNNALLHTMSLIVSRSYAMIQLIVCPSQVLVLKTTSLKTKGE